MAERRRMFTTLIPPYASCPITFLLMRIPNGYKWRASGSTTPGKKQWASRTRIPKDLRRLGLGRSEFESLRKRSQTSFVNPRLNVPVSNTLQIDHRGSDIAVPHPLL